MSDLRLADLRPSLLTTLLAIAVSATFIVAAVTQMAPTAQASSDRPTVTAPAKQSEVTRVVDELSAQGLTCDTKPRLTNTVVIERTDGSVLVASFNDALEMSSHGTAWVRAYCTA